MLLLSISTVFWGSSEGIEVATNPQPFYPGGSLKFWQAFALFYPTMTGIEAGMALSGSLKNPGRSLMIGNACSLIISALVYTSVVIYIYYFIPNELLISDAFALKQFAHPSWAVTVGIIFATASSSLGCLLAAPRMLQSMAEDSVVPPIFSKVYGPNKEPLCALLFSVCAAAVVILFTSIDQIIPILTIICLITYGLLNLVAALGTLMNAPSWRPKFKIHYGVSLFATALILCLMSIINPKWSIIGISIVLLFYIILRKRNLEVGFQDFRSSLLFFFSRLILYRLSKAPEHAYTWHPKVLLLTQSLNRNVRSVWLCHSLTKQSGILACIGIIPSEWNTSERINSTQESLSQYFQEKGISCVTEVQVADSIFEGYENLIMAYGMGPIQPNTIFLPITVDDFNDQKMSSILKVCELKEKNLILAHDQNNVHEEIFMGAKANSRTQIDIWWSSNARESFDLLMSYATMLNDSPQWQKATVNLRAMAAVSEAKVGIQKYLKGFISKSRLKMKVSVHQEPSFETGNECHFISKYSKKARLVLIPFIEKEEKESHIEYSSRLKSYLEHTKDLRAVTLMVCSYDKTEHREIYSYPESRRS